MKNKEYKQKVKFQCGCTKIITTLNYKPKIDNKRKCAHCETTEMLDGVTIKGIEKLL